MNKLLIALASLLCSAASYGQGTIYFNTHVTGVVDAPVTLAGSSSGPGPIYTAQLFLIGAGGSLTPLLPTTTFRDGSQNAVAARYVVAPDDPIVVPGVQPGGSAKILMGAWRTSLGSFDAAVKIPGAIASSAPVIVDNLGGGVLPAANLTGAGGPLKGFVIFLENPPISPEPSTIALGLLGGSALLLCRRK